MYGMRHRIAGRGAEMLYKKIDMELIVPADDADTVAAELSVVLDKLEERHAIFGGGIEIVAVEHRGTRKKSAFIHTREAGKTAAGALRLAGEKVTGALREII
jgi:hypothetical protein